MAAIGAFRSSSPAPGDDAVIAQQLSARVELAITKVLGAESDELDGSSFDAVAFINKKFPDEASLDGLERAISNFDAEIKGLDESILETVREQSTAGSLAAKDIADAKDSIGDLQAKIIEIKKKAEASEQMVTEICRDIKQLDVAKRHLTMTILTLARLKTLVSAVSQLQGHVGRRSYEEAAPLLEAAIQLFTHFTEYARVPKISELAGSVERIRGELKEMITEDFDILIDTVTPSTLSFESAAKANSAEERIVSFDALGGPGQEEDGSGGRSLTEGNIVTLVAACECVDALGPSVRRALIKSFNRKQLKPYGNIFRRGIGDIGDSLEGVDKRYAWFRVALRTLDERYHRILPKRWRVEHRLAIEFCEATRGDVERILSAFDPPSSAPAEALLRALLKTLAFEKEMAKKFEGADLKRNDGSAATAAFAEAAGLGHAGDDGEDDEQWDDSAPLYSERGELVDPSCAEGIRLKYRRKKEWEARKAKEADKRATRAEKRAFIASLAGSEPGGKPGADGSSGAAGALGRASLDEEITALARFVGEPGEGLISAAFRPYLSAYVRFERANIDAIVAQTTAEDMAKTDSSAGAAAGASSASILRSASALFAQARNAVMRCVQLNTGQTLFDLYKDVREALAAYAGRLGDRLPKPITPGAPGGAAAPGLGLPGDTYFVSDSEAPALVDALCLIVTTSEYCAETVPKFAESVAKVLDAAYRVHVKCEESQEVFYGLTAQALKALSGLVASLLDAPLAKLSKSAWTSLTEVGDQSPYVGDCARILRRVFPIVRRRLDEPMFRSFADKFVRAFVVRYQAAVYRAKRIGELGAQQLLLDAQAIKGVLLMAPTLRPASDKLLAAIAVGNAAAITAAEEDAVGGGGEGEEGGAGAAAGAGGGSGAPPAVYVKFIQREVPRVELLLKIVSTPKDRFADTIKALWGDVSVGELGRVMELKAMAKKEQNDVLVALGLANKTGGGALGAALGGLTGGMMASGGNPFGGAAQAPGGAGAAAAYGGGGGAGGAASAAAAAAAGRVSAADGAAARLGLGGMTNLFGGKGKGK